MPPMTFDELNLNNSLWKALDDLGYTHPTTIQQKAFSVIMSGRDVCGIAQTGTGKTIAYLLPALRMWKFTKDRFPQILILVPTRELVVQVGETVRRLAKYMTLEVTEIYGGVNMKPQIEALSNGTDVVVATPGRLLDMAYNGVLRFKNLKHLVIDEMDEMLDLGFKTQIDKILEMLPPKRQNLLFSATITPEVAKLADGYFDAPVYVEAAPNGTPVANIHRTGYFVPNFHTKANLLELLLDRHPEMNRVMVFTGSKALADLLYNRLEGRFDDSIGVIHSNKAQNARFNAVKRFQAGTYRVVIATDIVARGIDVSEVSHVVCFDTPEVPEDYIHRIGRTGRADKLGDAIVLTTEAEKPRLDAILNLMQQPIEMLPLPEGLVISDELIDDEMPKVRMKEVLIKLPDVNAGGAAFHEKLAKNKKVNVKVRHVDKMKEKYGKPQKRRPKR